jgi:RNase H-fold protein (predicted Holliday junction resolvase)
VKKKPNEMKRIGESITEARIGVALSDELQMLAHPTETIVMAKVADPWRELRRWFRENVELVVVGLPRP